ncbi:hypothetical protein L7F22_060725 [Adiantum nelumboides]|nr:hypothetical protein [Adiantum nelumboides]
MLFKGHGAGQLSIYLSILRVGQVATMGVIRAASGAQREALCQSLRGSLKAKNVEAHRIDEAELRLRKCQGQLRAGTAPTEVISADGDIESFGIFDLVHVRTSEKTFTGKAWGISVPGAGGFEGAIGSPYDAQILYNKTAAFVFLIADVELTVAFLDSDNVPLGVFEGFGESTGVSGGGGGSGSWV